tara:strand:- start:65 stop:448 length:384 start_codon:yes stop_codon:yes gene_type:complete
MANYLKYSFSIQGASAADIASGEAADKPRAWMENPTLTVFSSVDNAKSLINMANWDFTGLTPEWTLENSNKRLCVKIPFTDAEASGDEMLAFHNSVSSGDFEATITISHNHLVRDEDTKYVINDFEV